MYGRYDNLIAREAYRLIFGAGRLPQSNFPPRYNIAPTDQIPIVRVNPRDGEREVVIARWGLVPWWSKVILDPKDYDGWLDPSASPEALQAMLKPYPADGMESYAVSRIVNSVKNDIPACIEPIGQASL